MCVLGADHSEQRPPCWKESPLPKRCVLDTAAFDAARNSTQAGASSTMGEKAPGRCEIRTMFGRFTMWWNMLKYGHWIPKSMVKFSTSGHLGRPRFCRLSWTFRWPIFPIVWQIGVCHFFWKVIFSAISKSTFPWIYDVHRLLIASSTYDWNCCIGPAWHETHPLQRRWHTLADISNRQFIQS